MQSGRLVREASARVQAGKEFDIMAEKLVNDWNKLEIKMSTVVKKVCVFKERENCVFVCVCNRMREFVCKYCLRT